MPLIELDSAVKSYGAVRAVRDASLTLRAGEVRGLVGENGAGKSSIVRLLAGVNRPDEGTVCVDGEPVDFGGPAAARDAGIAVIYQEPTLFGDLSVAENVMMGRQPLGAARRIDRRALHEQVQELLDRLGVRLDARQPVRGLSIADQQIVEIAKALSFQARVLIMDEPTAALSGPEVERLFGVVRSLREHGAAVLFISHRLEEIFAICDTVTVMRDGEVVHDAATSALTADELVRRMVGRELGAMFPKLAADVGAPVLQVQRLTREGVFTDVSFEVRAGEIVALAGLVGAGRSEVARAIFGIDRSDGGAVRVAGQPLKPGKPLAAMAAGLAFVPEDRRQQGLVMDLSIGRNATLTRLQALARFGLLRGRDERRLAQEWAARLQLKYHRLADPVGFLSGGNQQKVVLAKWLATEPRVMLVDEPTRGIDVGTKAEVHRLLSELAQRGVAVLMVSSELPEVLGMADRVLVMHEGRITSELSRAEADEESVIRAATGQVGAAARDAAVLSCGTWSLLGLELDAPILDARAAGFNLSNERGVDGTTRLLRNVMGLWLVQECRREWGADYDELHSLAEAASPEVALFDPDDDAFLAPGGMPERIAAACTALGQPAPADRGALVRGTLTSLACKYRLVLEQLESVSGRSVDTIHVIGGGVRNALLCRLTADVCGRVVVGGPVEATALGNVLVQAQATGRLASLTDMHRLAAASVDVHTYEPADADGDATYDRFLALTGLTPSRIGAT